MSNILDILDQYPFVATAVGLVLVVILAYIADTVAKKVILTTIKRLVRETNFEFDDVLQEHDVFARLAHLAPALAIYFGTRLVPGVHVQVDLVVQHVAASTMVLVGISATTAFLSAISQTYATSKLAEGRPIEAYVQVAKIAVYILGGVVFVATLTGRSPLILLSGIGAVTAVLLLVFRDTILSFVASIQMASYDMVRVGDWIEVKQYGADGDVIELTLHTVKIRNFDNTITTIPTSTLTDQPFKNWRAMTEAGGRRIKRSFYIDMNSVRFLDEGDLDRLEKFASLKDYIGQKRAELVEFNKSFENDNDPGLVINSRRLTNVGTLRAYLVNYLRSHPKVHQDMTLLVRQLNPTPDGLPIELYVFTNDTGWVAYEDIQSDIFDHIFSIVPEFDLRVFQHATGGDFASLGSDRFDPPE
jgi:miniconductance mechanosensitive channel